MILDTRLGWLTEADGFSVGSGGSLKYYIRKEGGMPNKFKNRRTIV